jgi:alcohol dehydrogenase class IV
MHIASSMAGMCFGQNSCALTHGFGHAVGGLFGIHHGLSVGMFIPYAMQYYRPVTKKYLEICDTLAIGGKSPERRFASLIKRVKGLLKELDVPLSLKKLGISKREFEAKMDDMVLFAMEDIDTFFSPRPITKEESEKILRYAYDGKDIDF